MLLTLNVPCISDYIASNLLEKIHIIFKFGPKNPNKLYIKFNPDAKKKITLDDIVGGCKTPTMIEAVDKLYFAVAGNYYVNHLIYKFFKNNFFSHFIM